MTCGREHFLPKGRRATSRTTEIRRSLPQGLTPLHRRYGRKPFSKSMD